MAATGLLIGPGPHAHQLDDICIEHHLHANHKPEVFPFSDFFHNHYPKAPVSSQSRDPWHPFRTLLDFEVAELTLDTALNMYQTEHLIRLLRWVYDHREKFTIKNNSDLRVTWDASGAWLTPVSIVFLLLLNASYAYNLFEPVSNFCRPHTVPSRA
jgi:hypothetical protein